MQQFDPNHVLVRAAVALHKTVSNSLSHLRGLELHAHYSMSSLGAGLLGVAGRLNDVPGIRFDVQITGFVRDSHLHLLECLAS